MTDALCFLAPSEAAEPFDHSRKVECRALVPRGRPRLAITPEIAEQVIDHLLEGKRIRQIGKMPGMPSVRTLRRWIATDEEFRKQYLMGREGFVEDLLESILDDVEDTSNDHEQHDVADGVAVVRVNPEAIARSALKVKTKFQLIAKLEPRKYGDQVTLVDPRSTPEPSRNGDGAKVIEGEAIPLEQHPMYDQIVAWGKAARSAREAAGKK